MFHPKILRLLPPAVAQRIAFRFYFKKATEFESLYREVPLRFGKGTKLYDLIPGDVISNSLAFLGYYEFSLSKQIAKIARTSDSRSVFVDVGANVGYFTLLWAANASECSKVIAFEPVQRNITICTRNFMLNDIADRVTLIGKAASNTSGISAFDSGPENQTGWGGLSRSEDSNLINVQTVRLDSELDCLGVGSVDLLKIDVEGADTFVIQGCEELLRKRKIKKIFFEQNPLRMKELGIPLHDAREFLSSFGYRSSPINSLCTEWTAVL